MDEEWEMIEDVLEEFEKNLEENNAKYTEIKTYTTPRRLVFIIDGLTEMQADTEQTFRGPNVKVAYDANGNPTPAAMGFAKKFNANVADLYKIQDAGQEYIGVKVCIKGKSIVEIIQNIAADCVLKVQGSHFMRWEDKSEKFSRPVEHVLALYNDKVLENIELFDIKANRSTSGHRFSSKPILEINSIETYLDEMKKAYVYIDQSERKELIKTLEKEIVEIPNIE